MFFTKNKGFTLVGVLGFMTLSTVIVVGTFIALGSWTKARANEALFATGDLAARAGLNHTVAWITNHPMDAASLMQTFYDQGMNDPVKFPLDSLSGGQSYFVYMTAMETSGNPEIPTRIKIQSIGKGRDGTSITYNAIYSVKGIYLHNQNILTSNLDCSPDFALYLGGNSQYNFTKSVYVNGGLYTNRIQHQGLSNLSVIGSTIVGDPQNGGDNYFLGTLSQKGDLFLGHPFQINVSFAPLIIDGNAEFVKFFSTNKNDGIDRDIIVKGDLTISDWVGKFKDEVTITVNGNLNVYGNFTVTDGQKITFDVKGDVIFHGPIIKNTTGHPKFVVKIGGDLMFHNTITIDSTGGTVDSLILSNQDSVAMLGTGVLPLSKNIHCAGIPTCNVTNTIPTSWLTNYKRVSKIMDLDSTANYTKHQDVKIDTPMVKYAKTYKQLCDSAIKLGLWTTATPDDGSIQIDIDKLNTMAANENFVNKVGYRGFIIVNMDDPNTARRAYQIWDGSKPGDPSQRQTSQLKGRWAFINHDTTQAKRLNYINAINCFPETDDKARVLWWIKNPSFKLSVCDNNNDGRRNLNSFIYLDAPANGNNIFADSVNIHGSVYMSNANDNAFTGSETMQDSIWLDKSVLADIAPLGLLKIGKNGDTLSNCGTNQTKLSSIILKYFRTTSSQLLVKLESMYTEESPLDQNPSAFASIQDSSISQPFLDFSISNVQVGNNRFSSFKQFLDSTKGRIIWAYLGKVYTQGLAENNYAISSTSISSPFQKYTATCTGNWVDTNGNTYIPSSTTPVLRTNRMEYFYFQITCDANGKHVSAKRVLPIQLGLFGGVTTGQLSSSSTNSSSSISSSSTIVSSSSATISSTTLSSSSSINTSSSSSTIISSSSSSITLSSSSTGPDPCAGYVYYARYSGYSVGDFVRYNDKLWKCADNTCPNNYPSINESAWTFVDWCSSFVKPSCSTPWINNSTYDWGNPVSYNGFNYTCDSWHNGLQNPPDINTSKWKKVAPCQ